VVYSPFEARHTDPAEAPEEDNAPAVDLAVADIGHTVAADAAEARLLWRIT